MSARPAPSLPALDVRPQSVLLIFFGDHATDGDAVVATASIIDLLDALGIAAAATRATLARMARRGLLERVAVGRQAFYGLTPFGRRTVLAGRERGAADVVVREWDGAWTFVSFSLPDDSGSARHDLRSRLAWAGFGLLRSGLWCAPRHVDVAALLDDLGVEGVHAFSGVPVAPSGGVSLVRETFDLSELADRYVAFLERWRPLGTGARVTDPLAARVQLTADWSQTIRRDPRLPLEFLPSRWPALEAQQRFRQLADAWLEGAENAVRERIDVRSR